jgi:hypothetical protein
MLEISNGLNQLVCRKCRQDLKSLWSVPSRMAFLSTWFLHLISSSSTGRSACWFGCTKKGLQTSHSYVPGTRACVAGSHDHCFKWRTPRSSLFSLTLLICAGGDDGVAGVKADCTVSVNELTPAGFNPQFPASSAWVTAVGATIGHHQLAQICTRLTSGGCRP